MFATRGCAADCPVLTTPQSGKAIRTRQSRLPPGQPTLLQPGCATVLQFSTMSVKNEDHASSDSRRPSAWLLGTRRWWLAPAAETLEPKAQNSYVAGVRSECFVPDRSARSFSIHTAAERDRGVRRAQTTSPDRHSASSHAGSYSTMRAGSSSPSHAAAGAKPSSCSMIAFRLSGPSIW